MNDEIKKELFERDVDIIRFVDISIFSENQTLGFDKAILFCMALSKRDVNNDEFSLKEQKVEELADWLAGYVRQKGYRAHSQSQKSNLESGYVESAYLDPNLRQGISILPQKSIARIAGLGFIGKNNLLVTEEYGCAFCMCSVLTDAPVLTADYSLISSKCDSCDACVKNCPLNAICNNEWTLNGGRESLVDISKCCICLKCMSTCPWTLRYAKQDE